MKKQKKRREEEREKAAITIVMLAQVVEPSDPRMEWRQRMQMHVWDLMTKVAGLWLPGPQRVHVFAYLLAVD